MKNVQSIRGILSRSFATVDINPATGEKVSENHVSRQSFLASYEIDKLMEALRNN